MAASELTNSGKQLKSEGLLMSRTAELIALDFCHGCVTATCAASLQLHFPFARVIWCAFCM
jgi:hypothetical protein